MSIALGYTIRELRKEKGISQRELAEAIGMRANAINNYENGYRTPDANTVLQLAKYFSVSADYLLGLTPSRTSAVWTNAIEKSDKISELLKAIRPDIRDKFLPVLEDFLEDGASTKSYAAILNCLSSIMTDLQKIKSIYSNAVVDYAISSSPDKDELFSNRLSSDLADAYLGIVPEVSCLRKELCRLFAQDMKAVQAQQKLMAYGDTIPCRRPTEDVVPDNDAAEE